MGNVISQVVKGYELRELIGEGGFGAVYRAYQPVVGREVAIKIILPDHANQPEFIRRFEVEAQLVARLEHPYIVPLYDYWRDPSGAYLVMRLLRGGSLRNSLQAGGYWDTEAVAQMLDQIAAALMVAHQNGVVHRDLKPANILLDENRNAYLSDFGIAKDLERGTVFQTHAETVIGSPAYASPEQIMGEGVTPLSDLYSMGIILYELLTGQHPFRDATLTAMLIKQTNEALPPLQERRPDLPIALDTVIRRATAKNPGDRYPNVMVLAAAFRKALRISRTVSEPRFDDDGIEATMIASAPAGTVTTPTTVELPEPENPYKGLRAFQEVDINDFFGREALVERLVARLAEPDDAARFLAVIGPSGSGKSSVVRAGLIPALREGALPGSSRWFIVDMLPGAHPMKRLEAALQSVAVDTSTSLYDMLHRDEHGLSHAMQRVLPRDSGTELVLFVDQFEELFTLGSDEATRAHFLASLVNAVKEPANRLRVIIALRADFYDRPLLYPGLGDLLRQRTEVLLPLSPDELERAITGPADRVGIALEAGLIAEIVAEVSKQPGALPLLQYALTELFERREGRKLTRNAYTLIGGVLGALARRAEELYTHFDADCQEATRQLFLRLVAPGQGSDDTRRRVLRSELLSVGHNRQALETVIETYGKSRLLTFDHDPATRSPTIEVAHEALVREWARLREWLDASREDIRIQRLLSTAANEWIGADRDPSFLATGTRLSQFETLGTGKGLALSEHEAEYLDASIAERESRKAAEEARRGRELLYQRRAANRLRYLVAVMAIFLIVSAILSALAFTGRSEAIAEAISRATQQQLALNSEATAKASFARLAQSESRRLAIESLNALDDSENKVTDLAILLGVRALQTAYSPEADTALLKALSLTHVRRQYVGHTDTVTSVAFSPDGKYALTSSSDKTARLWDVQAATDWRQFVGHTDAVTSVAFSPDGKYILTGSADKTARLWDVQSRAEIRQFAGHTGAITCVAFSPDGKYVLTGSRDSTARLWNAETGAEIKVLSGHKNYVTSLAFSPDGLYIATSSLDNNVHLWDAQRGIELHQFAEHQAYVTSIAFSPDSQLMLTGSADRTVRLWGLQTGLVVRTFTGHTDDVVSVAFAPDGKYAITSSLDGTVRLWDTQTSAELLRFEGHADYVTSVAFAPDGKYVLTGSRDKTARLWEVKASIESPQFTGHTDNVTSVTFAPDGKYALTGSYDATARLWDVQTGTELRKFTGHTGGLIAFFSPDGKTIVTGSTDNSARLWDTQTGAEIRQFIGHIDRITSVRFSPDGKYVLTGSADSTARLWDTQTGTELHRFGGHTSAVTAVFSPDGKTILTCSADTTAKLWDTQSGTELRKFADHTGRVIAVFAPDGKHVLTASTDRTAKLWDPQTGAELRTFAGHSDAIIAAAFSPDSKLILTASEDRTARLWDMETGAELHRLTGHTGALTGAVFSPDGKYILTGSTDATARLWDAQTGAEIRRFTGHAGGLLSIYGIAFSADSRHVLTASADKTARMWNTDYHDLIESACSRVFRDFTDAERSKFSISGQESTCHR